MNAFFLAILLTMQPKEAPRVVASFSTQNECRQAADQANRADVVKSEEAKAAGAVFVCFQVMAD